MNWLKSSYSGQSGGNCVEVADTVNRVLVRDTKQAGAGPVLKFSPGAWRRFAAQVKRSLALDPQPGPAGICRGTRASRRGCPLAAPGAARSEMTIRNRECKCSALSRARVCTIERIIGACTCTKASLGPSPTVIMSRQDRVRPRASRLHVWATHAPWTWTITDRSKT